MPLFGVKQIKKTKQLQQLLQRTIRANLPILSAQRFYLQIHKIVNSYLQVSTTSATAYFEKKIYIYLTRDLFLNSVCARIITCFGLSFK